MEASSLPIQTQPQPIDPSDIPSSVDIFYVPLQELPNIWNDVSPILQRAVDENECEFDMEDVWGNLRSGNHILMVAADSQRKILAAVVVFVSQFEKKRVLFIQLLAGKYMSEWAHLSKHIDQYARENNCSAIECYVTTAMAKHARKFLPNYQITHQILVRAL